MHGGINKMERKTKIIISLIVLIISSLSFLYIMNNMIKKNNQCINNPMLYVGEETYNFEQTLGSDLIPTCYCEGITWKVYFNKDGIYKENPLLKGGSTWEKE